MHAGDLIFVLPAYLEYSTSDHLLRRARLKHVEGLVARLIRGALVDPSDFACPLLDLRVALDRGRAEVRRMQREKQLDQHRSRPS